MAKDGASVAQWEGDAVKGLEGGGGRKVADDGAAVIEVQDDVVVETIFFTGTIDSLLSS